MRKNYYALGLSPLVRAAALVLIGIGATGLQAATAMTADAEVHASLQARKIKVSGVVKDAQGEPLIGVNVVEEGNATNGSMTDLDGRFSLTVGADSKLVVSYVGFESQRIAVAGRTSIDIVMKEDTQLLGDLVVIGYGTVRKADLAGAVSVVDNKAFRDQPIVQISDALQGRVSGVHVENSGVPGGSVKVRVRGANSINKSNDPLYVVDGIVRESGLDGISPEDIQSMQVLKDASSTAIYGARGSNGVVMITTKGGRAGQSQVIFDASVGVSNAYKTFDLLNAYEYAQALTAVNGTAFSAAEMEAYRNGTAGVDWQDAILRTGLTQNYKVAFLGGTEATQYYLSGNYVGQEGIIIHSSNRRYQGRVNVSTKVTPWLQVTADVNASHGVRRGNDFLSSKTNPIWAALTYSPSMSVMNDKGFYNLDPYSSIARNPIGTLEAGDKETMTSIVTGRFDLKFTLAKGLTFTSTNGVDYQDAKGYTFTSKRVEAQNSMANSNPYRLMLQSSNNLTYLGQWGDHNLTATGVYEVTTSENRNLAITGRNLLTESVGYWNVALAKTRDASNGYTQWGLMSFVGRAMYNYADRYLLTATFRADGSSRFSGNKWGYFPSLAAAWTLSNERFMRDFTALQNIKLRASYGVVGNQAINPYETLGLMKQVVNNMGTTNDYTGYAGVDAPLPNLSWEKTKQLDLGLEFALLGGRLSVGMDYFYKRTVDALLRKARPDYMGGGQYWVNSGEISNRGLDLSLTAHILEGKDLRWSSTINATYLRNRVEKMAGGDNDFFYGTSPAPGMANEVTIIKPGESIGSFWGYEWTGLDEKGHDTYRDLDGNGKIDGSDRKVIGKAIPDFTFGWNNTLTYKNWDLNIFINGSFGASRLNLVRFAMGSVVPDAKFVTLREAHEQNFDKIGRSSEYASLLNPGTNNLAASSKWLERADYIRLENISLSYNLPKSVAKFADLRFTLSAQNLLTLTSYKGYDPAGSSVSPGGDVDNSAGIDMGAYPTPRTITFGVRVSF